MQNITVLSSLEGINGKKITPQNGYVVGIYNTVEKKLVRNVHHNYRKIIIDGLEHEFFVESDLSDDQAIELFLKCGVS